MKTCRLCNNELTKGKRVYCSDVCYNDDKKNRKKLASNCPECKQPLSPLHKSRYCCNRCKGRAGARRRKEKLPMKYTKEETNKEMMKTCKMCSKPVPKGRSKYCSDDCQDIETWNRARKRMANTKYRHKCQECKITFESTSRVQICCSVTCAGKRGTRINAERRLHEKSGTTSKPKLTKPTEVTKEVFKYEPPKDILYCGISPRRAQEALIRRHNMTVGR